MKWFQEGLGFTLNVPVEVDELPVRPDVDSATWQLRDQAGTLIGDAARVAAISGTTLLLVLDAADVTVTPGNETEARYVLVRYTVEGDQKEQRVSFGLSPFLPIEADAQTVRTILGISGEELANDEVDLVTAFYTLKETYGDALLPALASGKVKIRNGINRAVALKTCIDLLPSLQLRTYQTSQNENAMFTRFRGIDWDRLAVDLQSRLAESLADAGLVVDVTELYPSIFIVSTPTDPVTG